MRVADIFKKELIIEELAAKTKTDVLAELSRAFLQEPYSFDSERVVEVLLNREKLGSTGIGDGIAIPHGKLAGLEELVLAFGRSSGGVDFHSMDGKPVHLFFLLMAPENSEGHYLKALAKISRMLKDASFRKRLMEARSSAELFKIITDKDLND
jgi:PTS system nitrogen regulatory IIA component